MADVKVSYSIGFGLDWFICRSRRPASRWARKSARPSTRYCAAGCARPAGLLQLGDEHPVIQAVRRGTDTSKYFALGVPLKALNDYPAACPAW